MIYVSILPMIIRLVKTAKKVGLSRQTINSYYKRIRDILVQNQNDLNNSSFDNDSFHNSFTLKYINLPSQTIYYIECNDKQYLLNTNNENLKKINNFVHSQVESSLINHKKANTAKILYDSYEKKYLFQII